MAKMDNSHHTDAIRCQRILGGVGVLAARREIGERDGNNDIGSLGIRIELIRAWPCFGPVALAPLSECFEQSPVYIISYGIFFLYLLGSALAQSLEGFLVLRILSGMLSSVTIGESRVSMKYTGIRAYDFPVANFEGTIADLWNPHDTGPAMSVFLWGSTCKSPVSNLFLF
jgi:hypothetical protein